MYDDCTNEIYVYMCSSSSTMLIYHTERLVGCDDHETRERMKALYLEEAVDLVSNRDVGADDVGQVEHHHEILYL